MIPGTSSKQLTFKSTLFIVQVFSALQLHGNTIRNYSENLSVVLWHESMASTAEANIWKEAFSLRNNNENVFSASLTICMTIQVWNPLMHHFHPQNIESDIDSPYWHEVRILRPRQNLFRIQTLLVRVYHHLFLPGKINQFYFLQIRF